MSVKLTREVVETADPGTLWDDDPKARGFGIRIYEGGAKSFFINYRVDGRERRFTIGAYPTWSITAARAKAVELRKQIDGGEDPATAKRERREAPTVADLIERYTRDHLPSIAEREHKDQKRMLAEIADALGRDRKVADVHFGDIEALHRKITASKRRVRANRILAVASKMFSLALRPLHGEDKPWRDAVQGNPCKGVARNRETAKERFFSPLELAVIGDALADYPGVAADCVRLIMLTGCRPAEALRATWEQFDSEPGFWVKPSAHTKQRKTHKVPLAPPALELIERLRKERKQRKGGPWVFPGQVAGEPLAALWHVWHFVRERATVALWASSAKEEEANIVNDLRVMLAREMLAREPTVSECQEEAKRREVNLSPGLLDARIYDLRHTFASVGAGGGLGLPIIGRLLGHTQARTTQRYAHLADDPLKEAAAKIGNVIAGAGKPGAAVTPINRRSS
jgi:integrase